MVNEELIKRVVKQIEAAPRQWDQADWVLEGRCGTIACFAGWTLIVSGRMNAKHQVLDEKGELAPCADDDRRSLHTPGCNCSIPDVAQQLLGLDVLTAEAIFFWDPREYMDNQGLDTTDDELVAALKEVLTESTGVVFD